MTTFQLFSAILGTIGGAGIIVAGLSAWLGNLWANRILEKEKELRRISTTVDLDLRKRRWDTYTSIWKKTKLLTMYPINEVATYDELVDLRDALKKWYYEEGGILLSRSAMDDGYIPLQEAIAEALESNPSGKMSKQHYELVRPKCSNFRSLLSTDIGSRRESPLSE